MPRVVHFEINSDDPERAARFYKSLFGWKIKKWEGDVDYWMCDTGPEKMGINGGILKRSSPHLGTVNTIGVDSIDLFLKKIERAGGRTVMPKSAVGEMGWVAYCLDTEGNTFGIFETNKEFMRKQAAKKRKKK